MARRAAGWTLLGGGTPAARLRGEDLRQLLDTVLKWHPQVRPIEGNLFEFSVEVQNQPNIDAETIGVWPITA